MHLLFVMLQEELLSAERTQKGVEETLLEKTALVETTKVDNAKLLTNIKAKLAARAKETEEVCGLLESVFLIHSS